MELPEYEWHRPVAEMSQRELLEEQVEALRTVKDFLEAMLMAMTDTKETE